MAVLEIIKGLLFGSEVREEGWMTVTVEAAVRGLAVDTEV